MKYNKKQIQVRPDQILIPKIENSEKGHILCFGLTEHSKYLLFMPYHSYTASAMCQALY